MSRNLAVLVGNGLSIAYNGDLGLRAITEEMLSRIGSESDAGSAAVAAMKAIAAQALPEGVTTDDDFEVLVGAFGTEQKTLAYLSNLATALRPEDEELQSALLKAVEFAERVRDLGISHVLEVIFERSKARFDLTEDLRALLWEVLDKFNGRVTFGNLNYDTLLLSGLLETCESDLADLGHGYNRVTVTSEGSTYEVPALRRTADFPVARRVRLVHLHGSLTFWADRSKDIYAKLTTTFLRDRELWREVREGDVSVRPVVVLANQKDKSSHVLDFPFSLAYEVFQDSLSSSECWLIVGYSFRDLCVNEVLRTEFSDRGAEVKPHVLVVTLGEAPTRHEVERALGWGAEDGSSVAWLSIYRDGANDLTGSETWSNFHSGGDPL